MGIKDRGVSKATAAGVTNTAMKDTTPAAADQWLTESLGKGNGAFEGRIAPSGARSFYYRYTGRGRVQVRLPIGPFASKGDGTATFTVAQARARALHLSVMRRDRGIIDLRAHLAQVNADRQHAEALDRQRAADEQCQRNEAAQALARRLTVRQLFDAWCETDLQPRVRADGKRGGRKDGGHYVLEQFTRHVFPAIGTRAVDDVRKADLLALLDAQKAAGKMRTANVLLACMKQMLDFALERELITVNPLTTVKKSKVGGPEHARERYLADDEIRQLAPSIAAARMRPRPACAIWLTLATGVRVGELMGAVWASALPADPKARRARLDALRAVAATVGVKLGIVDTNTASWYLPDTKNERDHTIHLSAFALAQFATLAQHREALRESEDGELSPWVFPARDNREPVCVKSFGKQLADRQREPERRMQHRAQSTMALMLPGGRWTAHDLRRTAATVLAGLGVSGDVIDECMNHVIESRVRRTYIRDRRLPDQARAFDALGARLAELITNAAPTSNVVALQPRAA